MRKLANEMFGELSPWGKFWSVVGLVTLFAAAAMSFDFGWGISFKHALFLGCLSVITAFAPETAYRQWQEGKWGVTMAIAVICLPLFAIEFYTHAGYSAGLRGSNVETASVQNARYDARQEQAKEHKTNLEMWSRRLSDLEAANAWSATVTADALRAQLASANLAIDLEAKRGGCKTVCLARTKERDEIASKIAIAEEKSDLTRKIEATKRVLDNARDVAATTEHKSSSVVHQNEFLTKVVALVSNGTVKATDLQSATAEQSVNLAMAIAGTGLPAFALFMAGLFRRENDNTPTPARTVMAPAAPVSTPAPAAAVPQQIVDRLEPSIPHGCLVRLRRIAA